LERGSLALLERDADALAKLDGNAIHCGGSVQPVLGRLQHGSIVEAVERDQDRRHFHCAELVDNDLDHPLICRNRAKRERRNHLAHDYWRYDVRVGRIVNLRRRGRGRLGRNGRWRGLELERWQRGWRRRDWWRRRGRRAQVVETDGQRTQIRERRLLGRRCDVWFGHQTEHLAEAVRGGGELFSIEGP